MKKLIVCLIVGLMSSLGAFATDDEHEAERVKDSGVVLKEILNSPDNIPQDLLDKADLKAHGLDKPAAMDAAS